MKLIKPSYQIVKQEPGLDGIYKAIELAGRTCYSPDTEVLTDSGWKRIDSILNTDKVVSYNPISNTIIYDYPNLIIRDYDDTMIEINHPNIKVCVTKDHRIYQSIPEKRDYNFMKASQLAGIEKIPKSRQCRFRMPKYFISSKRDVDIHIPSIIYSKEVLHGFRHSSKVTIKLPCNEDFMVIAGAFISEGHTFHGEKYGSGSYCQITQTENKQLYNNVILALNNLGWKYRIDSDPRKPRIKRIIFGANQCWVMAFDDLFGHGSRNMHLPIWFRTLPDNYLRILISNMYLGDGSHNTTRNERYLSISKRLLDEVQEVFILLGAAGTTHFDENTSQMSYFEESHTDSWIISRKKHINTLHYTGKVYCTSTKSGIICVRYKGKTCWCGNCYKSENKITSTSAKEFVGRMISSSHCAMLEFGTVYLKYIGKFYSPLNKYRYNKYSKYKYNEYGNGEVNVGFVHYVVTNYRVLVENDWLSDLEFLCPPEEEHEKRVCVRFNVDIGVSREINRHRVDSIAEQSTRYCNFSKDKFGNEISIVIPSEFTEDEIKNNEELYKSEIAESYSDLHSGRIIYEQETRHWKQLEWWIWANKCCELAYMNLIRLGWKPQQARRILPLDLHTELNHCAFVSDWKHFFSLRDDSHAHPDMRALAAPLHKEMRDMGFDV